MATTLSRSRSLLLTSALSLTLHLAARHARAQTLPDGGSGSVIVIDECLGLPFPPLIPAECPDGFDCGEGGLACDSLRNGLDMLNISFITSDTELPQWNICFTTFRPPPNSTDVCPPGFICNGPPPWGACPLNEDILFARLNQEFGPQLGPSEPIVCPPGQFCADGVNQTCPEGFFCLQSATIPEECEFGTLCPPGTAQRTIILPLIVAFAIDALIILCVYGKACLYRCKGENAVAANAARNAKEYDPHKMSIARQTLEESFKRATQGNKVTIEFTELSVFVGAGNAKKQVLHNLEGSIKPGRVLAVMGPSGAGKSTFMSAVMGKLPSTEGTITINKGSQSAFKNLQKAIGFVPQEDIMNRELTVRQNLMYSASIRLPRSWSIAQRKAHVDAVLVVLRLDHVADSPIGDETKRGVSGGERKRVNVGIELCGCPAAIFLDEPTSGLDSTSSLEVMDVLQQIAKLGLVVVTTIHQPRPEIYHKLDDILILAKGKTAYFGPVRYAVEYFESLGFVFDPNTNPADFVLDVVSGTLPQNGPRAALDDVANGPAIYKDETMFPEEFQKASGPPIGPAMTALRDNAYVDDPMGAPELMSDGISTTGTMGTWGTSSMASRGTLPRIRLPWSRQASTFIEADQTHSRRGGGSQRGIGGTWGRTKGKLAAVFSGPPSSHNHGGALQLDFRRGGRRAPMGGPIRAPTSGGAPGGHRRPTINVSPPQEQKMGYNAGTEMSVTHSRSERVDYSQNSIHPERTNTMDVTDKSRHVMFNTDRSVYNMNTTQLSNRSQLPPPQNPSNELSVSVGSQGSRRPSLSANMFTAPPNGTQRNSISRSQLSGGHPRPSVSHSRQSANGRDRHTSAPPPRSPMRPPPGGPPRASSPPLPAGRKPNPSLSRPRPPPGGRRSAENSMNRPSPHGSNASDMPPPPQKQPPSPVAASRREHPKPLPSFHYASFAKNIASLEGEPTQQPGRIGTGGILRPAPTMSVSGVLGYKDLSLSHYGASFGTQIVKSHNRYMSQQVANFPDFLRELVIALAAGLIFGLTLFQLNGELFIGLIREPLFGLSSAPDDKTVPVSALIIAFIISLAGAPSGVGVFGNDMVMYWRETAAGHSPLAYYIGKTIATIYRITLAAFHFTAVVMLIATPRASTSRFFLISLGEFYSVYGLTAIIGTIVIGGNRALVGLVVCLIASAFCGFAPSVASFREWGMGFLIESSFFRWGGEAIFTSEVIPTAPGDIGIYQHELVADFLGYTTGRFAFDIVMMFIIGSVLRVIAYITMRYLNRDKQK